MTKQISDIGAFISRQTAVLGQVSKLQEKRQTILDSLAMVDADIASVISGKPLRSTRTKAKAKAAKQSPRAKAKPGDVRGRRQSGTSLKAFTMKALPINGDSTNKSDLADRITKAGYTGKSELSVVIGQSLASLKTVGLVTSPSRGLWALTKKGIILRENSGKQAQGVAPTAPTAAAQVADLSPTS